MRKSAPFAWRPFIGMTSRLTVFDPPSWRKADTFPANRGLFLFRPVKRRAEIQRQFFPHQFQHMEGCGSSRRRQVRAGVPLEMKHLQARVYHQRCRGVSLPDDALDGLLQVERGARQLRRGGARRRFCVIGGRQGRSGHGRRRVPRINLALALLLDKKMAEEPRPLIFPAKESRPASGRNGRRKAPALEAPHSCRSIHCGN